MPASPIHHLRFRILFFSSWLAWTLLQAWILHGYGIQWMVALADSSLSNILLMAASLLLVTMLQFYLPGRSQLVNPLAWIIVLGITWMLITRVLLQLIFPHLAGYQLFLTGSIPIRITFGILLLGWVAMTGMLWFNKEDQKDAEKRKQEAIQLSKEAELFKLRQQLQPHFLFNSLNSINALIGSQPTAARKMIQQLSDFLRGSLKKEENQMISLQEEINYLDLYLQIEKVRFGHRLTTKFEISEELLHTQKIPPFLLQPVMENAIKYGLYDTTEAICIDVTAELQQNELVIEIHNPFDAETVAAQAGTGYGLNAVGKRLHILFGRSDLLSTRRQHHIFTTKIIVPQV